MKKRLIKKAAKAFLDGRKAFPVIWPDESEYPVYAIERGTKLYREIHRQACQRGWWAGNHWDSPFRATEEEYNLRQSEPLPYINGERKGA